MRSKHGSLDLAHVLAGLGGLLTVVHQQVQGLRPGEEVFRRDERVFRREDGSMIP